jgi:tetratricopeptide (TPR) repeat protein
MLDQVSEPLEEVFERLRDRASRDHPEAAERYRRGLRLLGEGRLAEAIDDLEQAARAPLLRFRAAARLGRLHLASGDLEAGVTWLDLAAESAAPEPEEGRSVLYDLADTLERLGDGPRALAIMIEIEAESGGYRDVRERIERLTRAGAGSPEA